MIEVAIDWGSTSFRAYRFDNGKVVDYLDARCGIKIVLSDHNGNYADVLREQVGHWLSDGKEILLAGMVTSANGWIETPYIPCPLHADDICRQLTTVKDAGLTMHFVPGVSQQAPQADVMRGEEVQLLGLANHSNGGETSSLVVMPGTHSKWALIQGRQLAQFTTIVTGELYSALVDHTLLGKLVKEHSWCNATFTDAVELGFNSTNIISKLFSARSAVLLNRLAGNQVSAYLSGLLIGAEFREGCTMYGGSPRQLIFIGSEILCEKYLKAARHLSIDATQAKPRSGFPDITSAGFAAVIEHTAV